VLYFLYGVRAQPSGAGNSGGRVNHDAIALLCCNSAHAVARRRGKKNHNETVRAVSIESRASANNSHCPHCLIVNLLSSVSPRDPLGPSDSVVLAVPADEAGDASRMAVVGSKPRCGGLDSISA